MLNTLILILIWGVYLTSFGIYVSRRQLNMRMGLNIGIIHMVLVPFSVFAFERSLPGDPGGIIPSVDWVQNSPAVLRILGMVGLYGVWDLASHSLPQQLPPHPGPSLWDSIPKAKPIYLFVTYIFLSVMLFVVIGTASGEHWATAKHDFMATGGSPALIAMNLHSTVRLATLIVLAALYLQDRVTVKWFLVWIGVICALDLYLTGNRISTLRALVIVTSLFMVRRQWFLLTILAAAMIPFGVLMTMFTVIRNRMHSWSGGFELSKASEALGESYVDAKDFFLPDLGISKFLLGVSEGINVNVLITVVEDFHQTVGLLMGSSLLRGFAFWIPRSIWPNKPETFTVLIGTHLMGSDRVSMGATIFGEFWANFGFFGVVMIPPVLYILDFVFRKLIRDTSMRTIAVFIFGYSIARNPVDVIAVQLLIVAVILNMTRLDGKAPQLPAQ